ncbi:MAG: hypothetical protein Q9166_003347 [cf. Caloplaca sp. 2 TL-2023]
MQSSPVQDVAPRLLELLPALVVWGKGVVNRDPSCGLNADGEDVVDNEPPILPKPVERPPLLGRVLVRAVLESPSPIDMQRSPVQDVAGMVLPKMLLELDDGLNPDNDITGKVGEVVDDCAGAPAVLDNRPNEALTQRRFAHPKGRVVVDTARLPLVEVKDGADDTVGAVLVLGGGFKEALRHSRSEQPKARVEVGLPEVEDADPDPGVGVMLGRRLKDALTQRRLEQPKGRLVVVGLRGFEVASVEKGVTDDPGIEVEDANELKETLTQRRLEQPKGRLVVGLEKVELGFDVVGVTDRLRQTRSVHLVLVAPGLVVKEDEVPDWKVNGSVDDRVDCRTDGNVGEMLTDVA